MKTIGRVMTTMCLCLCGGSYAAEPLPTSTPERCLNLVWQTTKEVKADLMGKTPAAVKDYFGRTPDSTIGEYLWSYNGNFYDADAEKMFNKVIIAISGDHVRRVDFYDQ